MKRLISLAAIIIPPVIMIVLFLVPEWDRSVAVPIFHFYIVTFSTFTAAVVALLLGTLLDERSQSRHRLLATAFASMAGIFFIHGLTTTGALILEFNPGIRWAAWLTMFIGGLLFALAAFDRPGNPLSTTQYRRVNWVVAIVYFFFAGVVFLRSDWLTVLDEVAYPLHGQLVFWATFILWVYGAFRIGQIWRETRDRVDGTMALVAIWLLWASVSMHQFPTWNLSWWLYHLLLLGSALITFSALINEYEQLRHFRPTSYYFALGLVLTALVSLMASYLLSEVVDRQFLAVADSEKAVIEIRRLGLLVVGGSMAALFLVLLFIVRRAEKLLAVRTDQLAEAYANLQESESMRADLTNMIVHDLRSPLTGINLSIDLLGESFRDPDKAAFQERFLANARGSIRRMLTLINQLLDMTRLEAGQLELHPEPLEIEPLLRTRTEQFRVRAEASNIQLLIEADEGLPVVLADTDIISRVVDNLVDNALKFTNAGGHVILKANANDRNMRVQVQDSGGGIPSESLKNIFDKYAQVRSKNGDETRQGTGLGLPFCKLVVEAHNGRIWADSTIGVGSTFSFTLPIPEK